MNLSALLLSPSSGVALGASFLLGLLSSLTPCVYPLIPVTLALFGARGADSRLLAFTRSLSYVLGIAATYTLLGVISAKTGSLFGNLLQRPEVVYGEAAVLFFLVLATLDAIHIRAFSRAQHFARDVGGHGIVGAFVMGTASGLVAAPCVGPALVVMLGVAAQSGEGMWGALLLFCYSLGMGVPFLLLGTFSTLLSRVPKGGGWLNAVKVVIAIALAVVALSLLDVRLHFIDRLSSSWFAPGGALLLGVVSLISAIRTKQVFLKVVYVLLTSLAIGILANPEAPSRESQKQAQSLSWFSEMSLAQHDAERRDSLIMVDFFAEWCAACKELEVKTFPNPEVVQRLSTLSLARIDLTDESPEGEALTKRYNVAGLPAILFLRKDGSEIPETRVTGFMPPDEFVAHLTKVGEVSRTP